MNVDMDILGASMAPSCPPPRMALLLSQKLQTFRGLYFMY